MTIDDGIDKRLADLAERERAVAAREKAVAAKSIKHNLYDRITLSKGAVDAIIIACAAAIMACVICGIVWK